MSKTSNETSTRTRVLATAVEHARKGGIEAVTHKGIANELGLSSSNVLYYHPTADHLRRAVAHQLLQSVWRADFERIERWVACRLPENHDLYVEVEGIAGHSSSIPEEAGLQVGLRAMEALAWLARNGPRDPEPAE